MKYKKTVIKEDEYKQLKLLLDAGMKQKVICETMGRSKTTVYKIKLSNTFDEYVDLTHKWSPKPNMSKITNGSSDFAKLVLNIIKEVDQLKTIIKVINQKQELVNDANVIIEESNKRIYSAITEEGQVQTMLNVLKAYEIYIRKYGRTYKFEMLLPRDESLTEYTFIANVDFEFKPLRKFTLKVYFDTGKYSLRKDLLFLA